jgi:hypothetical protein
MMRIRPISTSITLLMALIVLAAPLIVNIVLAAFDKPAIEKVASSD